MSRDMHVLNSSKLDLEVITYADVLVAGEDLEIYRYGPDYTKGSVGIYIDGNLVQTKNIDGGYDYFAIDTSALSAGNHTYEVRFTSDLFDNASYFGSFEIANMRILIPKNANLNDDNEKATSIVCYFAENITGTATLYLDGLEFERRVITSPSCLFSLRGLQVKDYGVEVVYSGDENHPAESRSGNVHLSYGIDISDEKMVGGWDTSILVIRKPADLNGGRLTVTVGEKVYYDAVVEDNLRTLEIDVSDLAYGKHNVVAKYTGDVLYPALEVDNTIEVQSSFKIPSQWSRGSEVSLALPDDAQGNLSVNILKLTEDFDTFSVGYLPYLSTEIPLVNGRAALSLDDFEFGSYIISCSYSGSDYGISPDVREFLMMPDIKLSLNDTFGGLNTILIDSPVSGGELNISLNDWDSEIFNQCIPLVNNKANYTFKNELLGGFTLSINYAVGGKSVYNDDYYFKVVPNYSLKEEFTYAPVKNITVEMPEDTIGHVTVNITTLSGSGGEICILNASFKDGVAIVNMPELPKGNYIFHTEVNTSNYGFSDSDFYNLINSYYHFESDLKDANLKVDVSDIDEGNGAVISIEIDKDATGVVLINVGDKNVNATISGGKATGTVSGLSAGNYTVIVRYLGSEYVSAGRAFAKINVAKSDTPADNSTSTETNSSSGGDSPSAGDVGGTNSSSGGDSPSAGDVGGTNSTAPSSGGNKTEPVDSGNGGSTDNNENNPVDSGNGGSSDTNETNPVVEPGSGTSSDTNETNPAIEPGSGTSSDTNETNPGVKPADPSHGSDENATVVDNPGTGENSTDVVPPVITSQAKLVASNVNMMYYDGSYFKVKVYGTDGKVAKGVSVVFKVNGKKFKTVKTDKNGYAKVKIKQLPKKYRFSATALGKTVTKTVKVKQILSLKTVAVKKSAGKIVLTATLKKVKGKYLKNKKITFKFNGKKVKTVKTNKKGIATVTVDSSFLAKLKVGKKVKYQAIYVKNTVTKSVKVKK